MEGEEKGEMHNKCKQKRRLTVRNFEFFLEIKWKREYNTKI